MSSVEAPTPAAPLERNQASQVAGRPPEALTHIAQRLASIVEFSDDAIASKDLNGIVTSWNRGAERIFGYSAEEIVGRSITILIPPDHLAEEPRILERIRRGERVDHYETVRRRKDGSLVDISLTVSPIKDAEGKVVGASKIARDISERKRAAEALSRRTEEQEALYQFTDRLHRAESLDDLYEAALDAILRALCCERASILLADEAGEMQFVAWRGLSDGYRRAVTGHSPWTVADRDPRPICINDIDRAEIQESLRATVKAERIGALTFIPLMANGRLIGKFMAYYDRPHCFTPDETNLALTISRQLGFGIERIRAQDALRAREAELETLVNRTPFMLARCGRDLRYRMVSDALAGMLRRQPGEVAGKPIAEIIGAEAFERIRPQIEQVLKGNRVEFESELPFQGIGPRFVHVVYTPEYDERGIVTGWIASILDITERKQAEAQRELLVAELSHRVKNTLATVISIARQSFSRNADAEEARASFEGRIRALAQTHGRLADANWSGVSFQGMLLDEFAPYRREDGSNVRLSGPGIMLNAKCAVVLGMAFHELVTNAAKHGALSSKAGRLDVAWEIERPAGQLRIRWIESDGPAVTPPQRSGFGRLLLERALASDLRGVVEMDFAATGLRCEIVVPLEEFAHNTY